MGIGAAVAVSIEDRVSGPVPARAIAEERADSLRIGWYIGIHSDAFAPFFVSARLPRWNPPESLM